MEIYDPLFGKINIPSLFEKTINSKWFRRLQELRQLGLCYLSFPGGNHSRFEHSIGTYYLSTIIGEGILESTAIAKSEHKERLSYLLSISALCHDIGHGPFSHMTENVLIGLGAKISHEEIGAAIITHMLNEELKEFNNWGITPELIGGIISKDDRDDPYALCVMGLISSDVDIDRIEYLHRDLHYSGVDSVKYSPELDLAQNWILKRYGERLFFELTGSGVTYSEKILFLRRNNYQRIVYESRHMSATSMFEKAMDYVFKSSSWLGEKLNEIINIEFDWKEEAAVRSNFDNLWELYGITDFQAINLINDSCSEAKYLIQRIRRGRLYETVRKYGWSDLHYLSKQAILRIKNNKSAFTFRRKVEKYLADNNDVEQFHITVNIAMCSIPKPLTVGVEGGNILAERSALGYFFANDQIQQYKIEVFVDNEIDSISKDKILKLSDSIFTEGNIDI